TPAARLCERRDCLAKPASFSARSGAARGFRRQDPAGQRLADLLRRLSDLSRQRAGWRHRDFGRRHPAGQHGVVSRRPEWTEHPQQRAATDTERHARAVGRERHLPALCQLPGVALPHLGCPEPVLRRPLTPDALRTMAAQSRAESDYWNRYRRGIERVYGAELAEPGRRRAPGLPPPASAVEPIVNPAGLPPPRPFETGGYVPLPDRWRILDALGRKENPFDPYNTNT